MVGEDDRRRGARIVPTRRQFLQTAAVIGAGVALTGDITGSVPPVAAASRSAATGAACARESVGFILNLAYAAEHAAMALYYTALTSPALLRSPKLAGASGDLQAVGPDGNAQNCANLQAALDQEQKHALILASVGATSPYRQFYFPAAAFQRLGYTGQVGTFLWVLDHLETACISGYLTAVRSLGALGRPDIATMCVRNLAVECEHRALYRVIAGDDPADNITLPVTEFACLDDALTFFRPYLTGQGFPAGAAPAQAYGIPTPAQIAGVVGRNHSI